MAKNEANAGGGGFLDGDDGGRPSPHDDDGYTGPSGLTVAMPCCRGLRAEMDGAPSPKPISGASWLLDLGRNLKACGCVEGGDIMVDFSAASPSADACPVVVEERAILHLQFQVHRAI